MNDWTNFRKTEYSYDEAGNLTLGGHYKWDSELNYWTGDWKREYSFDEAGNQTIYVSFNWDSEANNWVVSSKSFYYYSSSTGIYQKANDKIVLFPNPTSGIINTIGLTQPANIKIYNLQGQLLNSYYQVNNNTITLSDLHSGVYIMNLMVGDEIVVKKIVKE